MKHEQLVDHLDNVRLGKATTASDTVIHADAETEREWDYLRVAIEGLEAAGLYEEIAFVKAQYKAQQAMTASQPARPAVIRSISRISLRVAACLLLLSAGAVVYKYAATSANGIYSSNCPAYDLSTSRGAAAADQLDEAYRSKDWTAVTDLFKKKKDKTNKSYFLAGMAYMQSKNYDQAIDMFQQVIAANTQSGGDYFEDEAEFYLAMSWLARNDVREAMPLLDKIRADKNHQYHDIVEKMSTLDLRIAQYKELK